MPCTYCPSHLTVPWEGLDGQGLYQSVPFAMPYTYCPSHLTVPWEGLGLYKLSHLPPLAPTVHPILGRNGRTGIVPKCPLCYALYLLSIPSHCTMGRTGQTGVIPKCPLCYALYLLSIPSHCTMGGTGRTGVVPKCPLCYALYLLSIPSHCTMGGTGRTRVVPKCPICYALYVLSIPSHIVPLLECILWGIKLGQAKNSTTKTPYHPCNLAIAAMFLGGREAQLRQHHALGSLLHVLLRLSAIR